MAGENTGEHVFLWQIKDFTFDTTAPQSFLQTPIVVAKGLDSSSWQVRMYPRGREQPEHMEVLLHRCPEDDGPKVLYLDLELCLIDKDGNQLFKESSIENQFTKGMDMRFPKFLLRDEVISKRSDLLPNDVLTLKCRAVKTKRNLYDTSRSYVRTEIPRERRRFTWAIRNPRKTLRKQVICIESEIGPNWFELECASVNDNFLHLAVVPRKPLQFNVAMSAKILATVGQDPRVLVDGSHFFTALSREGWHFTPFDLNNAFGNAWDGQKVDLSCELKISADGGDLKWSHFDETLEPLDTFASYHTTLLNDLNTLYERNLGPTITISDRDVNINIILRTPESTERIWAHQIILSARSPVFREILDVFNAKKKSFKQIEDGNNPLSKCGATVTKEGITVRISEGLDSVVISGTSPEILKLVLQCMYTDSLDLGNVDEAILAYKAACYLQFPLMQCRVRNYLRSVICPSNLKQILTFAYGSGEAGLKADYRKFIRENLVFLSSTEEWVYFCDDHDDIVKEILSV